MKILRSWLFVPGDSEKKLGKARSIAADALILDLEDSVADERQGIARQMVSDFLVANPDRSRQQLWVRINPLNHDFSLADLATVIAARPDGIVQPKVNSAKDINRLADHLLQLETKEGLAPGSTNIAAIATETARSMLTFHTYLEEGLTPRLKALTWGAEDLATALGASGNRDPETGQYDPPFVGRIADDVYDAGHHGLVVPGVGPRITENN